MESVESRFIRYAKIDTESIVGSDSFPSTAKQFDLLNLLKKEVEELGLTDITLTDKGYLYATLESNTDKSTPTIGFVAHVDTSPDMSGKDVNPQIVEYKGGDIVLNKEKGIITKLEDFPELSKYIGHTLITTDGTTLLGADDKAGVAEIISAMAYLKAHPEVEHGKIRIGFTPDEEVGGGADHFDVELFGADFAYTMDGSSEGELEYENFNAAGAKIEIQGRNVHPGYAKNKMINAFNVAIDIDAEIPELERPQFTTGYEGFYHLVSIGGSVDKAHMDYIIRDHNDEIYLQRIEKMKESVEKVNAFYGKEVAVVTITEQYRNMRSIIENGYMHIVERADKAMKNVGIAPLIKPIRGGTDGSRLSYMGLPCPNIFAGGENFHGRHEFISISVMNKAVEFIIEVAKA